MGRKKTESAPASAASNDVVKRLPFDPFDPGFSDGQPGRCPANGVKRLPLEPLDSSGEGSGPPREELEPFGPPWEAGVAGRGPRPGGERRRRCVQSPAICQRRAL